MHLTWVPREYNEEADALSNLNFKDFDQERRVPFDLAEVKWLVLHELIQAIADMFKPINAERER